MRKRWGLRLCAAVAIGCAWACGADDGSGNLNGAGLPTATMAGSGGALGGAAAASAQAPALGGTGGTGGVGTGTGGAAAASMGTGGGGAAGMAGSPSAAGGGGASSPADLSGVTLEAIGANGTIGLDWTRIDGATGYRVYWSKTAGVTPANGQAIDVADPSYVHRALDNGSPYYYVVTALSGGVEGPPSPEATATPHGEWVLEQLGSGDFDDVVTGQRVPRVPIAERVHVLLFAEGYTSADLAGFHDQATHATGDNDVDRWQAEVFAIEPYSLFKEAFVIWFLPRASAAHLGEGETAFHVGVSGGGVTDINSAAAPMFDAIDGAGDDAFAYPPGTSQAANVIAAFLLLDPQRGRAGFSGVTTFGMRSPTTPTLSVPASFGIGQAHEFTHAFSRVSDEYIETSSSAPARTTETTNVVASNRCDDLPWAHLLEGRGINTTPGLVGAFGTPELGYHPELKCLMNGTHDNGTVWCQPSDDNYTTLTLRPQRLCNYCRELTAFHVFERTGLLSGTGAFDTWKSMYRGPFYQRFGFSVPAGAIPQTLQCNRNGAEQAVYEACMP